MKKEGTEEDRRKLIDCITEKLSTIGYSELLFVFYFVVT